MTVPGLPLLNKLLYTSDMIGGQAVAQAGNLWLLFFLAPPRTEGASDAVPGIALVPLRRRCAGVCGGFADCGAFHRGAGRPRHRLVERPDQEPVGPATALRGVLDAVLRHLLHAAVAHAGEGASFVNAIWVFVILELFFLSNSMSIGPYESLLPEIAKGHRDRMSIVAWQFYFGVLGAVLGLVVSGVVQDTWGFQVMGVLVGVLGLGFRYLGVAGVWRHAPRDTPPAQIPLKGAFLATLSNTQFLYFLPTFVLYQLSTTMTLGWMPFFVKAILGAENEGFVTSLLTGTALVGMMVAVFAMWKLSHTKGKRWVYSLCLLGTAVILPFMFFVGFLPGIPILAQGIFGGVSGRAAHGRRQPHAPCHHCRHYGLRRIRTGMRREGMFFASQNLFEKVGSSFSALFLSLILLLGETADDPLGIRLLGPVAGAIAFVGYWVFRGYRLPSTVTREKCAGGGVVGGSPNTSLPLEGAAIRRTPLGRALGERAGDYSIRPNGCSISDWPVQT